VKNKQKHPRLPQNSGAARVVGKGRKEQTAPIGNPEGAAKIGVVKGHQSSHDFWERGKIAFRPARR